MELKSTSESCTRLEAACLTLLSVADNHEFLAGVAGSLHRYQQLSDILLNLELCLSDEDSRLCFGSKTTDE